VTRLFLIRHGKAKADWGSALDPGLDKVGLEQARKAALVLAPKGPLDIISSPLARALETAAPLAEIWGVTPKPEERVGEIASPVKNLSERDQWLEKIMADTWSNLDHNLQTWRGKVIDTLLAINNDTVVFTHFIAINAAVGAATRDDRVVNFLPDNGSITILGAERKGFTLIERGVEAYTQVR
jgi:broad specificity phosphatase PhoE